MEKKLQRNEMNKMIGGVASGLAEYFDVEATWVRLGFCVVTFAGGSGILAYLVLWIVMPAKPFPFYNGFGPNVDYKVPNSAASAPYTSAPQPPFQPLEHTVKKDDNGKLIAGCILIGIGTIFLIGQLRLIPDWFTFGKLWPLALIIPGIFILTKATKRPYQAPGQSQAAPAKPEEPASETNTTDNQNQTI